MFEETITNMPEDVKKFNRCILNNHIQEFKVLLKKDINKYYDFNWAIQESSSRNHIEIVETLINDKRINIKQCSLNFALNCSVEKGNINIVNLLLKHSNVNPTSREDSSLHFAIKTDNFEIFNLLLQDERIDPSKNNNISLFFACQYNLTKYIDILWLYPEVKKSVKITVQDTRHNTEHFKALIKNDLKNKIKEF
jgi:ankyrin repeat protein